MPASPADTQKSLLAGVHTFPMDGSDKEANARPESNVKAIVSVAKRY